uniref:Uncharacterized protein n=1 Tax=Arundo donax TaxID=35708 RepID=A0A0A9B4K7_ARUDO
MNILDSKEKLFGMLTIGYINETGFYDRYHQVDKFNPQEELLNLIIELPHAHS